MAAALEIFKTDPEAGFAPPRNTPWARLVKLPELRSLTGLVPEAQESGAAGRPLAEPAAYTRDFTGPLDRATEMLRAAINALV